jgi:hypothetical protein
MADALSEALQKLSVARTGSQLRTYYQSPAPSEQTPVLPTVVGQQECPEAGVANSAVENAYCDQASMTLEIATAQAMTSECLTTLAKAPPVTFSDFATSFVGSTSDPDEGYSSASMKLAQVETTHLEPTPADSCPKAPIPIESNTVSSATSESRGEVTTSTRTVAPAAKAEHPPSVEPPGAAGLLEAPVQKSQPMPTALPLWKRPAAAVLEHRRNAAAVVVLICMAMFWFDDPTSSTSTSNSAETMAEDFSDVEAALSEFDVRSAPEMKEPAEPIEVPTAFNLTIPTQEAVSNNNSSSNPSEATATYPDSYGGLEVPASNGFGTTNGPATEAESSGFSAAPVSAPAGSGRSVRARLSHSIQPIN